MCRRSALSGRSDDPRVGDRAHDGLRGRRGGDVLLRVAARESQRTDRERAEKEKSSCFHVPQSRDEIHWE
ncbi:hypothetical protein GCM10027572_10910 [Flexivirga lutea]